MQNSHLETRLERTRKTRVVVFDAVMAALGVVLMLTIRFPLIPLPGASHLLYDFGDIPAMLGGIIAGPIHGMLILGIISLLQLMTPNSNGFIGFIMHFLASGALVMLPALFWKWKQTKKSLSIGLILGAIGIVLIMIPLNLIITPGFFGVPLEAVLEMIVPILLPFNLLKGLLSGAVTYFIFSSLVKATDRKIINYFD